MKTNEQDFGPEWAAFIAFAQTLHYGRMESMEFRGKRPRFVRLVYDLNFENLADLNRKLEELHALPQSVKPEGS